MTTKSIQILSDKRLYPAVMNLIEGDNNIDTAVYTLDDYNVEEHDLSTYQWYVMLIGVDGFDDVLLTSQVVNNKLEITFDLTNYVTDVGNTLTYQLVAKDNNSAVWNSSKGVILNAPGIRAEDYVISNYPSILKQWEERIQQLGLIVQNAYVVMPYDDSTPIGSRVQGRFYLQRLNDVDYQCIIEDADGHIIIDDSSARKNLINTGYISNCVVESPQYYNIKYENNNIILKAGSKVFYPNGFDDNNEMKFTEVITSTDYALNQLTSSDSVFLAFPSTDSTIKPMYYIRCHAGENQPTTTSGQPYVWWDTANNIMKYYNGSTWSNSTFGLPICISQARNLVPIDWFVNFSSNGMMGNYVFFNKGIKIAIPDGRYSNGRLKSILYDFDNVKLINLSSYSDYKYLFINNNGTLTPYKNIITSNIKFERSNDIDTLTYVIEDNRYYNSLGNELVGMKLSEFSSLSGILITSNTMENPISIANDKDLEEMRNLINTKQDKNIPIETISSVSGTIVLGTNKFYKLSLTGTTTFSLPNVASSAYVNKIELDLYANGSVTINWGTTLFANGIIPNITTGYYKVFYIYHDVTDRWICNVIKGV